jgi:hypothetical protein
MTAMKLPDWFKWLNPANLLLLKDIIDLIEAIIKKIEELFGDDEPDPKP